ncbi:RGS domain-containing protein [Caenorhabditis elegans]|uniref:RGS domain-containing protein n=1 Tax=Caenorhabditis elegans TaxID=6239 RepID=D1MN65_CAEEL|nr:RGS domain-containing protein [Caenorhabditis elegans]CBI63208.1 RGS domain-containing protein [Caenorhabditis elegans]|eukprot:NP_001255056.1 Regulator of G-protein signaling rgs-1 [Caenorhabditis elegans]
MGYMGCWCSNLGRKYSGTVSPQRSVQPEALSYEMVYSWQQSFDTLMSFKSGQKCFAEFLKSEYSDENILFWQACEELKREKNSEKMEEKARIIYEDFISILSPKEVSLDSKVREIVNTNMSRPTQNTFEDAQHQIYQLMARDSYPRFLTSIFYRETLASFGITEMDIGGDEEKEREQRAERARLNVPATAAEGSSKDISMISTAVIAVQYFMQKFIQIARTSSSNSFNSTCDKLTLISDAAYCICQS